MKINFLLTAIFILLFCSPITSAQNYPLSQTGTFSPQNKKILLLKESGGGYSVTVKVIYFCYFLLNPAGESNFIWLNQEK